MGPVQSKWRPKYVMLTLHGTHFDESNNEVQFLYFHLTFYVEFANYTAKNCY